jgi:anaerobic ribonucleoside-triphosphate reductase activating protein
MKIHSILDCSCANGPGSRFVVWVQGCSRHCEGCFNLDAQTFTGGIEMSCRRILAGVDKKKVSGLTVSGGEPFEQDKELAVLLRSAKKMGLSTLVYTGFTWEELSKKKSEALKLCDYLIDGAFEKGNPSLCRWAGSGNQRFLMLQDGHIGADMTCSEPFCETGEITIEENGTVVTTGFLNI